MDLKNFLQNYSLSKELKKSAIFLVPANGQVPIIFIQDFISLLKKNGQATQYLSCVDLDFNTLVSCLETSFLGISFIYYLKDLFDLDKNGQKQIIDYIREYEGPHLLLAIIHDNFKQISGNKNNAIVLPESIDESLFILFSELFYEKKISRSALHDIISDYKSISLDQSCMLLNYLKVVGKKSDCKQIFEELTNTKISLFLLSQYFFSKEIIPFFKLWNEVEQEYSIPFWCSFWSEQLFRACFARYFIERKQMALSKSIGYRLPFSYLQKDWKRNNMMQLKAAHQDLYQLELEFKNGSDINFDLFFIRFFYNK